MEKDGDRSTHITGPATNSPISSGEFHAPVTYNYININFSSKEIQSVLRQVKETSDEKYQIQGSSDRGAENITNLQELKRNEAVIKMVSNAVNSKEEETGLRI